MLLIVHQCFLMMLSREIIFRKSTLQTTNLVFFKGLEFFSEPTIQGKQQTIYLYTYLITSLDKYNTSNRDVHMWIHRLR